MTWDDLLTIAEISRQRNEAWRNSQGGRIHREELARRDAELAKWWADHPCTDARPHGGDMSSISAGANSAGRT